MIGELFDYPFRGKADILQEDNIVDLKTTNDVQNFHLSAERLNYDVQCYIYCELFGYTPEKFVFLCLDKKSLDLAAFNCSEEFYERGKEKVIKAIKIYEDYPEESINDYIIRGTL